MKSNYFASNLKYLRTKKGLEQRDISEMLGLKSPTSVTNWEKGTNMARAGHLNDLASYFNIPLQDLVNTNLQDNDLNNIKLNITDTKNRYPFTEVVNIPVLGTIACGDPIIAEENIEEYKARPMNEPMNGNLFYLRAKGDSMEPKIPDGSYVLIREQADVENGEIAAVLVNGDTEATLKKIRKLNDIVLLEAINDTYEPYIIDDNNPATIIGKAVEVSFQL